MEDPVEVPNVHDSLIHGISISVEPETWTSELRLDIDHIVEWQIAQPQPRFQVSPAVLVFRQVTDLRISIDSGTSGHQSAVSGPFIESIYRELAVTPIKDQPYFSWMLKMTDGRSFISLGASDVELKIIKPALWVYRQYLTEVERHELGMGKAS